MYFSAFMLAFWLITLILGLIDYLFIPSYDLRLLDLLIGLLAGSWGQRFHLQVERREDVTS